MEKQFWLGNYKNINQFGWSMDVELIDGPHKSPNGVKKAEQIIKRIGLDKGKNRNYVMVAISEVPDIKVKLNQEAIEINKKAVDLKRLFYIKEVEERIQKQRNNCPPE